MKATGIICEYNPFHNGHLLHLQKTKELQKDHVIVLVMSSHFMQRGEVSIINKWDRTQLALKMGVDLVIELPFPFATQSADIFAKGSIEILHALKVENIVFGSESGNTQSLEKLAKIQLESKEYHEIVKEYLKEGVNYPTAMAKAFTSFSNEKIDAPNDLLGLSYIKAIYLTHSTIKPIAIKRRGNYHDLTLGNISSGRAIRKALQEKKEIDTSVPKDTLQYLKHPVYIEDYFPLLKYQILTHLNSLYTFQTVDEGIGSRIKKNIIESESLEELIMKVKTKRYTYNKLSRMFTHILCNFTKEEAQKYKHIEYIRVLGFSEKGQMYLRQIKKETYLPIITRFGDIKSDMLNLELRATSVYASILCEKDKKKLITKEYNSIPQKM